MTGFSLWCTGYNLRVDEQHCTVCAGETQKGKHLTFSTDMSF